MNFATLLGLKRNQGETPQRRHKANRRRDLRLRLGLERLEVRTVPTFLAPVTFAVGSTPVASVVGDFNGDGRVDVVVTGGATGTVKTLLSNGDGTFQAPISSPAGLSPQAIVTADFNGDGKLDVAASQSPSGIDILYGNGDGTFQPPIVVPTGAYLNHLAVGDVNGDGLPDIVGSSTGYGGTIFVYKNMGGGVYTPGGSYSGGLGAFDVELADFNHDGKLDIIEANTLTMDVRIYQGNGDGTFGLGRSLSTNTSATRLAIGDFNRDGNLDFVAVGSTMSVMLGNSDGTFRVPALYPGLVGQTDVQVADFNGDGIPDLVESNGLVELGRGDGSFYAVNANPGATGSTVAVGDFNGDGAPDAAFTATATSSLTVLTNAANDSAMLGGAVGLVVTSQDVVNAGVPFTVTVSAVDANGNVVPNFTGTVGLTNSSTLNAAQAISYTFTAADAGVHTLGATMTKSGLQPLTVTSPLLPSGVKTITVMGAAATHFSVTGPATAAAGVPASVTVTALDAFGNLSNGYVGSIRFTSIDARASLPANYTFSLADAGTHAFPVTFVTAGSQTVTAIDATVATMLGATTAITVTPASAVSLRLAGGGGPIGSPTLVTATALDTYGNVDVNYTGTLHLTTTDANSTVSADVATVNGVGTFTVNSLTLGAQTLNVVDVARSAMAANLAVVNTPGLGAKFVVTSLSASVAGTSQSFKVTVYDNYGNISTGYRGVVQISGSDARMNGAGYYSFTAADSGAHTFTVAFTTAGTQSLTLTDYYTPAINFSQTGIAVTASSATSLAFTPIQGVVAGTAQSVTVTLRDAYGNIATGYRGTVLITSSDTLATLPAAYTFTAADAGSHTFSITYKSSGGQTLVVQDTVNTLYLTSSVRDVLITASTMTGFAFRAPSNATAGLAFSVNVSAVDVYGNAIIGYRGKIHFTGASGGGNLLPADFTFTAADSGSHNFSITFTSTGTLTLGVADVANGAFNGQTQVVVKAGGGGGKH